MEDTRARWERAFLEALDFDTWGQVEEAIEGYQRLQVAAAAEYVENVLQLPNNRREGIGKLAAALKHRVTELQSGSERGVGLVGMKNVKPYTKDMIISDAAFPLPGIKPETTLAMGPMVQAGAQDEDDDEYLPEMQEGNMDGTLRGQPANVRTGDTMLVLYVDRWCFKDATEFIEPRVAISVRDSRGEVLEPVQETPISKATTLNEVFFEQTVYIQTPLNRLPPTAAIFFEFRHYKPAKKKKSVKCYCYLEMDEIKNGPVTLEVYKKPAIYNRNKQPSLLTVKPLYLHLEMEMQQLE